MKPSTLTLHVYSMCASTNGCYTSCIMYTYTQVALATFGTFALTSNEPLTSERAFVALALFNVLRYPIIMLPMVISMLVQVGPFVVSNESHITSESGRTALRLLLISIPII